MPEVGTHSTWDPVWEQIFSNRDWGRYPPEHVIRFVEREFGRATNRRDIRLLEIGCGPGANVWFMAREGFTVAGIDGSSTAIQKARERLSSEGMAADLRVGDFAHLPWPDDQFDGVVENVSLYANPVKTIRRTLDEVRRVLRPGAPFLSSFFTDKTWGYGRGEMIELDGFVDLSDGPLSKKGFCFFLRRARVPELFGDFSEVDVERISRTVEGERYLLERFVIVCRKPAPASVESQWKARLAP